MRRGLAEGIPLRLPLGEVKVYTTFDLQTGGFVSDGVYIEPDIDPYAEADSLERIVDDVLTRLLDEWNEWWDHKLRAFLVQLEECARGDG